eukprot:scaffold27812_cov143-Skeletonema_menzelii.AAC.2
MMMQHENEQSCSDAGRLHYDNSPASSYKKGNAPGNHHLVSSPSNYLSPKSKAFLTPSENVGDITPPTSKASSSPGDDYSPMSNYSRESSGGIIDHTALLLGLHEELEDESDDEAKHCCFSPMASADALDGAIDSDDDVDDLETVGSNESPLQLAIDTNRGVMTVTDKNIVGTDLSLVTRQLDVKETIITKADDEPSDTVLKAASVKTKASSVISAKAQKAKQKTLDVIAPNINLSHGILARKSEQRINDELSAASSKGKLAAKQASEMVASMKEKAAQKAHDVKDKATQRAHKVKDMTLEVVGRKTYHKTDELSHNGSEAMSLLSDEIGSEGSVGSGSAKASTKRPKKLPNLPRPPKTLSLKKGTINKKFMSSFAAKRTQSKATIDQCVEQQHQIPLSSPGPSSIISPTNSYDMSSCIDADGFLLSPQSSLGFISPTASIDEYSSGVAFDAFSETDRFADFETSSTSRMRSNTDEDSELLSKELKAAIQSKARKPPLLPPSGRPRQK